MDAETASWVIVDKAGNAIAETFLAHVAAAINRAKYDAIPIQEYLGTLNARIKSRA